MTYWIDAQLPPRLCAWLTEEFGIEAVHVGELDLLRAEDHEIFAEARRARVTIMTKDRDFVDMLNRTGPPPNVVWIRLGNTSNENLRVVLGKTLEAAIELIRAGEALVEIRG